MSQIRKLWNNNEIVSPKIEKVQVQESKYNKDITLANNLLLLGKKLNEFTVDPTHLDEYIVSDNEQYYYKQWKIELVDNLPTDIDNETFIDLFLPSVTFFVIYTEPTSNELSYYNTGREMQEVSCWEINSNKLFLNLSVFIQKPFGGAAIINPQASIYFAYKPFFEVKQ